MSSMADKKTVLIIEDEVNLLKIYQAMLKDAYEVLLARDWVQAEMVLAKTGSVNMILLDLELPGKSGLEVMRALRKDDRWKNVPVVAMSNMSNPEITEYTLGLGAKEFVVKSDFDINNLVPLVQKYIS